ncbi:MAG: Rpn family recombination-promoting nuclease/putative transposase [Candidatus Contendobacter sp.]|nr:Rpn family recombination-promoting nuclease/putative transposase [Candidatus Contendobacter sp.]MDS4058346.1 Rpn family recombination-promoting nuclease/putative transposase [Candidatus Contendobacter sp.]
MRFINPKTDFAFKRIFGSEQSREVLIDFLDAVLYGSRGLIADLEILNPWLAPRIRGMKDTYLDVRARLTDNRLVIIEMQVLNVEGFEKRILYNAAKTYSNQLRSGEDYLDLHPVIALTLTDFVMFESYPGYLSRFVPRERDYLMDYPVEDLELVFIELPKFATSLEELGGRLEQWLYFIKHAPDLTMIPPNWAAVPALRQAFDLANRVNLEPDELEDLERREVFIADQRNALRKAEKTGFNQGHAEGRREQTLEIARALLDVLDLETISAKTGLTLDELRQLRSES